MKSLSDQQLLREYGISASEAAFAELARRYVDFVYSAALRMVRNSHLAEDVTQGVFLALAQNSGKPASGLLSAWLHRTTRNLAAKAVRSEVRRRAREQESAAMNQPVSAENADEWEHIAPHLDATLDELPEPDREALLLRYFQGKSAREMALAIGTSEEAAQKRVSRALERLRYLFAQRGVTVGATGLVAVISAHAIQAAPSALVAAITSTAALSGSTVATAAASTTKIIAMTTLQKVLIGGILVATIGTSLYQARQNSNLNRQMLALQQQNADQIQQLINERDQATNLLASMTWESNRSKNVPSEILRLRGEVARLRSEARPQARLISGGSVSVPDSDTFVNVVSPDVAETRPGNILTGTVTLKGKAPDELPINTALDDPQCGKGRIGNLTTHFYQLGPNQEFAGVVISLQGPGLKGKTNTLASPLEINQESCEFLPSIVAAQIDQKILIKNSDPVLHNVHVLPAEPGNHEINLAQAPKTKPLSLSFPKPEQFLKVKCDVHPWMFAWVTVFDHPFFAVTDKDGSFKITGIPPGKYKLQAAHHKAGTFTRDIEIKNGEPQKIELVLEPKL